MNRWSRWLPRRACRFLETLARSRRGSAAVFAAVAIPVAVGLVGLGIDSARLYQAHSRLQSATDAAALAGSLQLPYDPDLSKGLVRAAAVDYLERNMPEAELTGVAPGTEVRSVRVTARTEVDVLLLSVLGAGSKVLTASAAAGFNNLEVVFVVDNSGSMKGSPIAETNQAASELVNLMLPEGSHAAIKVGLVPFRGKVHIPGGVDGLDDGCRNADGSWNWDLNEEYTKAEYRYPSYYSLRVTPGTCESIPRTHALTDDREEILTAIATQDALGSASGTVISEGLKWGRHVLTPEAPFTEGSAEDEMRKIMILLTDGDTEDGSCGGAYSIWYTPNQYWTNAYYGMLDRDSHCEDGGALNSAMLAEARRAKDAGIEIFCIRFGSSDGVDVALMQAVASSKPGTNDHYFDAPSAYDIGDVFKLIGRQLGWRLLG